MPKPSAAVVLADADLRLGVTTERWRSLAPERTRAHTLSWIGASVVGDEHSDAALAWARGLVEIATAMHDAFPDNLFWDLDYLGASLWRGSHDDASALAEHAHAIAQVQHLFGRHGSIGFAYVHDFVYGFDWAKWVAREPQARTDVAPFGRRFIAVMQARGEELVALLAAGGNDRYPPLGGESPRNPFGFSRAPADEITLHRHLAAQGSIPVAAWTSDAQPDPGPPYAALRVDAAQALGLTA